MTLQIPSNIEQTIGPGLARRMQQELADLTTTKRLSFGERLRVLATGKPPTDTQKLADRTYRGSRHFQGLGAILRGEYRPNDIDYQTLEKMRKDPTIQYALALKIAPVQAALKDAYVECPDPRIKAFVQQVLVQPHLYTLCEIAMQALIDGSSFSEKRFKKVPNLHITYDDPQTGAEKVAWAGYAVIPKGYRYNLITTIKSPLPIQPSGDFDGYIQEKPGAPDNIVPAWKAFVFPRNFARAGFWGESALNYVYPAWFYLQKLWALRVLWFSKHASPTRIGYAPTGLFENEDGEEQDALSWLADRLWRLEEHITMALPADRDEAGNRLWEVAQLDTSGGGDPYGAGISALESNILKGMVLVEQPPHADSQGRSYYEGMSSFESFLTIEDKLAWDFLTYVNDYIVKQLVVDHFGARAPDAQVRHNPLFSLKKRLLFNTFQILVNAQHPDLPSIALVELAKMLNVPTAAAAKLVKAKPEILAEIVDGVTRLLEQEIAP